MPQLSETGSEGTVTRWLHRQGDTVAAGEATDVGDHHRQGVDGGAVNPVRRVGRNPGSRATVPATAACDCSMLARMIGEPARAAICSALLAIAPMWSTLPMTLASVAALEAPPPSKSSDRGRAIAAMWAQPRRWRPLFRP